MTVIHLRFFATPWFLSRFKNKIIIVDYFSTCCKSNFRNECSYYYSFLFSTDHSPLLLLKHFNIFRKIIIGMASPESAMNPESHASFLFD